MDFTAPHLGFVYASYGLTALAMAGLLIWVLMRSKRLATELRAKGLSDPGSKTES